MVRVEVRDSIGDLASDLANIPPRAATKFVGVVRSNVREGNKLAQGFARESSGPHGKNYWKRLSGEMTGPYTGEYGPTGTVVGNAVGAGWRHGPPNTDLPKSADIIGPKFAKGVGDVVDGLFW